jgi:hypothetical protein
MIEKYGTSSDVTRSHSRLRRAGDAALAAAVLVVCHIAVHTVPFAVIARRIHGGVRPRAAADPQAEIARVRGALGAARRRFRLNVACLATAIAANRLLAWRGIPSEIRFGVKPSGAPAKIDAHAWLVAEGTYVTGAAEMPQYAPLYSLPTHPKPVS